MKRVLLVTRNFPPTSGGVERVCADLADARQAAVTVLTEPTPHPGAAAPYEVIRRPFFTPGRYPTWLPLARAIVRLARDRRVDLVVFGHYAPYAIAGRWLARSGIPYAVYCHGFDALAYTQRAVHRSLLRQVLAGAATVFVNSRWTGRQLEPYVAPWRQAVLYPGVDIPAVAAPPANGQELLAVGRFVRIKGYDVAIEALLAVREQFPGAHLSLVGDGPERPALHGLVQRRGLQNAVTFTGALAPRAWRPLLERAALVLQPSRSIRHRTFVQEESFGLAALEAAAAGRTVVATAVGGVPEVVSDGLTGRLVPPDDPRALADAINALLADSALTQRLADQARRRAAERFSRALFQERVAELIDGPNQPPLVSVCIPAYNASRTLAATLDSLARQSYRPLEVIVADDGSTDGTADAARRAGVRVVQGHHRGASAARNAAAQAARGQLLFFSDADCRYVPEAMATLVAALRHHPEAAFAYSSLTLGGKTWRLQPYDAWALAERNFIPTMALIRRADFLGFDERLPRLQDWDLWLRLAERGRGGVWVDRILYRSEPRGGVISGTWFPKALYRFPRIADRLSRGAGLTLRAAEALVRERHPARSPRVGHPAVVCPRCRGALRAERGGWTCSSCGGRYTSQQNVAVLIDRVGLGGFKADEIRAHTPVLAWRRDAAATRSADYHEFPRRALRSLPSGSRLLEVACGERPDLLELARAGYFVTVTDIAPARVERALRTVRRLGLGDRVHGAAADGEQLPFADAAFDAAYVAASFHHFPDPRRALHELRRVVRPGGFVILALEPQRWPYQTVFRWLAPVKRLLRRRRPYVEHSPGDDTTEGFTAAELHALARNEGLTVVALRPAKVVRELADQCARLLGKCLGRTWDAPAAVHRLLQPADWLLERLPGTRALAWHWTLITRVP